MEYQLYRYGKNTMTGGRIKRIKNNLEDKVFCLSYGDGVSNVNIKKLINFHMLQKNGYINCGKSKE